jgi:hypothetical protein
MQKVLKKYFKKQNLLVRWDKKRVLTSEPAEYTQNAFKVEYFTHPAEHEIQNLHLTAAPTNLDNRLEKDEWEFRTSGRLRPLGHHVSDLDSGHFKV